MSRKQFQNAHKKLRLLDFGSATMWALAWIVLAYTIATPSATAAAALGSFAAFFAGKELAKSELRTPSVALVTLLAGPILLSIADFPNRSPLVAGIFPTVDSLVFVTDFLWWGCLSVLVVSLLQFLSSRYQFFVSVEVITVALFLALPFAAHRDGFINRPYFLIDPLWSRGYDPVPVLQGLGLIVAVALILLTIGRATQRSSVFDLTILVVLAGLLYLYVPQESIRELVSDPPGASGLTGEPKEAKPEQGQAPPPQGGQEPLAGNSGGGQGEDQNNEFPFENQEKSDPKPVAVVIFRDDYDSPDGYYYFRQTAFSQFNGFRLVKDTTSDADNDLFRRFPTKVETRPLPEPRLGVDVDKLETRVALISSHTEPFGLTKPVAMQPVANPNPDKFERAFEVVSLVFKGDYQSILGSSLVDPNWSEETLQHYLQYPDKDPRYKELVDEIVAGIPEQYRDLPLARVLAINLYLGEKGKYTTRKRPVSGSKDPTADFLFGDMTGYCVHFSHSSVYLLRAAGIPARVGAGYAVESRDRRGSALMILSSRAHAWPEVWIEGLGWYPMDVAPQTYLDAPVPPPDFDLQSMLAEMAREEGKEFDSVEQIDLRQMLRRLVKMLLAFSPWVFGALLFLCYGLKLERRYGYLFEKDVKKVHAFYKSAIDKAHDSGLQREMGQGRLSFAEKHQAELPALTDLTLAHLSHSFGREGRQKLDIDSAQRSFQEFHQQLADAVPLWRRILGALNPIGWYFSR